MAVEPCRSCGRLLTSEHGVCPHCGAEAPTSARGSQEDGRRGAGLLQRAATAVVLVVILLSLLALLTFANPVLETWRDWLSLP